MARISIHEVRRRREAARVTTLRVLRAAGGWCRTSEVVAAAIEDADGWTFTAANVLVALDELLAEGAADCRVRSVAPRREVEEWRARPVKDGT